VSAKQAINDKLQGSVATYLRCVGVVNNQIKKGLLLSLWVNFLNEYLDFISRFCRAPSPRDKVAVTLSRKQTKPNMTD